MLPSIENDDGNNKVFAQRPPVDAAVAAGVERLLKTNIQPLDIERTELENAFVLHNEYAAKLAQRQAQVDAARRELEVESRVVEEHMSKIKTILHPVRSLPNEILYEILFPIIHSATHTPYVPLGDDPSIYPSSLNVKRHPLWIFSHVCKRWRDHLLSLPRLWSYIHIPLARKPLNTFGSSFLVRLLVSRSGDHPLHISFQDEDKILQKSSSLSEIFLHYSRWKTLQLCTRASCLHIFDCGSEDFSILESIQFTMHSPYPPGWSDDYDEDEDEEVTHNDTLAPYQGFSRAQNLRRVHLDDPWATLELLQTFPWNQITHLSLLSITNTQVANLLPFAPQLIDAKFWLKDDVTESSDSFVHDTLRCLTVRCASHVGNLIGALRLPALESLSITKLEDDMLDKIPRSRIYETSRLTSSSNTFQGLVSPTGSCVTSLSVALVAALIDTVTTLHSLSALLESTPVLDSLSIRLIGHESMDEICLLLQSTNLVPRLNQLTIWATHGAKISDILIGMMELRRGKLKTVDLRGVSKAPDAVLAQLDQFVEDGMTCKISHMN